MIVLICADWVPTFHWCVLPAGSRLERRRAGEGAPVPNVNVHGPAARSLTIAATLGGVSKNKSLADFTLPAVRGSEPEAKTGQRAVGVG